MPTYRDENGLWEVNNNVRMLIEPSESFEITKELERQDQEGQNAIDALVPPKEDVLNAEIELKILNTLIELGVI